MKVFQISEAIDQVDLSPMYPYVEWHRNCGYFKKGMGEEHYKLLASVSAQCDPGNTVYDIGSFVGMSALALAYNPEVRVVSYDVNDCFTEAAVEDTTAKQCPNIRFQIADCTKPEEMAEIAKAPIVFLDVDPHDGVQETQIFQALQEAGFRGLLFLDDIYLDNMKNFWNSIPLRKHDISLYGHHSGTGVVVFDETAYDVSIG